MKLYKPNVRLNVRKHVFQLPGHRALDQLSKHVVDTSSVNSFKNRLDRHWKLHVDLDTDIKGDCLLVRQPTSTSISK